MTVTDTQRLPQRCACSPSISGQSATTIIVAQMSAGTKGRNIHAAAAASPTMKNTPIVVLGRSAGGEGLAATRAASVCCGAALTVAERASISFSAMCWPLRN